MEAVKISHIGIAVSDLQKAINNYQELFDFERAEIIDVGLEGVKVAMLKVGESEIELLCPTSDEGTIAKFLREHGEGMHHLAIKVPDVSKAIEVAKAKGFRVLDSKPRKGARGVEAAFVHPKSFHGVLLEFYSQ